MESALLVGDSVSVRKGESTIVEDFCLSQVPLAQAFKLSDRQISSCRSKKAKLVHRERLESDSPLHSLHYNLR